MPLGACLSTDLLNFPNVAHAYPAPGEEYVLGDLLGYPTVAPELRVGEWASDYSSGIIGPMLADLFGYGGPTRNQGGMNVMRQTASLSGWVYVAIDRKRNAVSQVPGRVYRSKPDGSQPDEIIDPRNDFLRLMRNPNPMDTRSEFWGQTITHFELTGNALWLKQRANREAAKGPVKELWCIPSQFIFPACFIEPLKDGYFMDDGFGNWIPIPSSEIVHFRNPNPRNRFWGWGTLAACAESVKAQDAIKAAQLAAFNNDLLSTLYFSCKDMLTDVQWKRMYALLKSRYGTVPKAGTPMLLENGVEVGNVRPKPAEMAFLDSSKISRDEILSIFGVPPVVAGLIDVSANLSNTASQERIFEAYTVKPLCVRLQERINKDLAPEFGDNLEFEFDDPVQEDRLLQAKLDGVAIANGKDSINEIREREGQDPVDWGHGPRWWIELQEKTKAQLEAAAITAQAQVPPGELPESGTDPTASDHPEDGDPNVADPAAGDLDPKSSETIENPSKKKRASAAGRNANHEPVRVERPPSSGEQDSSPAGRRLTTLAKEALLGTGDVQFAARQHARRAAVSSRIHSDLDELEGACIPTLRKFFANQAKRVQENVAKLFGAQLGGYGRSHVVSCSEEIFCVTAGGSYARLYPDGTTAQELGAGRQEQDSATCAAVGRIGRLCVIPGEGYCDGEWIRGIELRVLNPEFAYQLDDWEAAADQLADRMLPRIEAAMKAGGNMQYEALGLDHSFDLADHEAQAFLLGKQRKYWLETVNETTKKLLSERLAQVLDEVRTPDNPNGGPTLKKLSDAVEEVMGDRIKSSPECIARTEIVGAYNASADITRTNCHVSKKEWFCTHDGRTRHTHVMADGQKVPQYGRFLVGGAKLRFPGDPAGPVKEIVRCRCTAAAVFEK